MELETIKNKLLDWGTKEILELFLRSVRDHDLFYERTASALLWGYKDPVLHLLKDFGLTDDDVFALEVSIIFLQVLKRHNRLGYVVD